MLSKGIIITINLRVLTNRIELQQQKNRIKLKLNVIAM